MNFAKLLRTPFLQNTFGEGLCVPYYLYDKIKTDTPEMIKIKTNHCVKRVRIRSYSGPYFPAFGLNTDQNNSKDGHSSRSKYD